MPGKSKKDLNAEMNKKREQMEKQMRASLAPSSKEQPHPSQLPDQLIPPNSSVRGKGCKCGKGLVIDLKQSAKDGIARSKPAPGWGSNAQANYDPVPPGVPRF